MIMYSRELTVAWGESDPFGLVYFPRMLAWFNDTEHEMLRAIGFATEKMIAKDRSAFVMGDIHFKFIGPAAYGDRVRTMIQLSKITKSTLHWDCKAVQASSGALVCEGRAIRIHARIMEDGNLSAQPIPDDIRRALSVPGSLVNMDPVGQ
ncbi:MAG: acyl-CoA thioesterase [Pseudooceanicola sp.]|nr:acyl-CoA thioesterase [Pseudooceanicola sp.]